MKQKLSQNRKVISKISPSHMDLYIDRVWFKPLKVLITYFHFNKSSHRKADNSKREGCDLYTIYIY